MRDDTLRAIEALEPSDHIACLFDDEAQRGPLLAAFIRQGLERGERVLYLTASGALPKAAVRELAAEVDLAECIASRRLVVLTDEDTPLRDLLLYPESLVALTAAEAAKAQSDGHTGLRMALDMTAGLSRLASISSLLDAERRLHEALGNTGCVALCQYDQRQLDSEAALGVLRAHPLAIVGGAVYRNFYYLPPDELLTSELSAAALGRWLWALAEERLDGLLDEQNDLVSSLVDGLRICAVLMDGEGRIQRLNRPCGQLTGHRIEDVRGRRFWDVFYPPDAREEGQQGVAAVAAGEYPAVSEEPWVTRDGDVRLMLSLATGSPDDEGQVDQILYVGLDITERKRAEEALRRSEKKFRTLFDNAGDAIFIHDLDCRFLEVNLVACDRLGLSHDELVKLGCDDIQPPECAAAYREQVAELTEGQNIIFETVQLGRDGAWLPCEVSTRLIEFGGTPAVLCVARDVTERKKAEDKLQSLTESLERRVTERTEELRRSNEELEQFAYVASHDLQEPLRMVASYLQLLHKRYESQLDETADEFIGQAVDGARRMQALIDDLLEYSRVGTRGRPVEPADCEAVLAYTLANLGPLIEDTGAVVSHRPLPTVSGDRQQLVQLFQNLIGNAIKFRGEEQPRVDISAERQGDEWVFSVADNGIGIDPEHWERVFVVFERLHSDSEYTGTGIGLAVCKRIVERHGGRIWVESEPGRGSVFRFTLLATGDAAT